MRERIADWLDAGTTTFRSLAVFRMIFSVGGLVMWPTYAWLANYPSTFFQAPPGPFELLKGWPPEGVLIGIDIAIRVLFALLLVGVRTETVSVALTVLMMFGEGLSFALGKIDHTILFVLTPAFMAYAGWGKAWSIDAKLRQSRSPTRAPRQWVVRAFAVTTGVAFLTASLVKIKGGWLNPHTQAAFAYQLAEVVGSGKDKWLAPLLIHTYVPFLWEVADWGTVLAEGLLIVCALSWRSWRAWISILVLFHLGVYLSFNISFWMNLLAYGAFVAWDSPQFAQSWRKVLTQPRITVVGALGFGVFVWLLVRFDGGVMFQSLLLGGATAIAVYYLYLQVVEGISILKTNRRVQREVHE